MVKSQADTLLVHVIVALAVSWYATTNHFYAEILTWLFSIKKKMYFTKDDGNLFDLTLCVFIVVICDVWNCLQIYYYHSGPVQFSILQISCARLFVWLCNISS